MRILHVLTSIDPAHGGTVEAVRNISAAMLRSGILTEVLSLETPHPVWLDGWSVKVHWIGDTRTYYRYTNGLVPWLRRKRTEYDAVLVHGVWRYPSAGVWRALHGTTTPYFLFTHGMLDPWFRHAYPIKHIKKSIFWLLFEYRALRDARSVLFTNEEERRLASQTFHPYECREEVVGLGIANPPSDPARQLAEFFGRFPFLRGRRLFLFLSRIHRKKGCDLLIQAFAAVASLDQRLHLVIAGPDEEGLRPELERLAAEHRVAGRITWVDRLGGGQKWGAFRAAELFVLPSHTENYGIAIVEALACGLPVLITDKVNIWREIARDDAGLVAHDNVEGVTSLLRQWCSLEPKRLQQLSINARRCYRNRFEIDAFTDRFVDYLARQTATANPISA